MSAGFSGLLRLEAGSQALSGCCAVIPHPLVMTADYVRQVVLATWRAPSPKDIDRRVRIAGRRRAVLQQQESRPRLRLSLVVDEAVLHQSAAPPGSVQALGIQWAQLDRFVAAAGRLNVTIQLLPYTAGFPPVSAGSFPCWNLARATGAPDVVYLENKTRIFFIDAESEGIVTRGISRFSPKSPSPAGESTAFISDVARALTARTSRKPSRR